ncbi:hypothetical protein chiPu_0015194 [Chiloscyllium punctatum]|uniref:RNase H type-1 domain-containing protein n=1 Tax=Chiloscyllium punctatum TaxID=137246 RepID=A0A401T223_CHIPU|nr:hypothetical protein [Chiloscyllium punctatum]
MQDTLLASWRNNACDREIEVLTADGTLKGWEALKAECEWADDSTFNTGTGQDTYEAALLNKLLLTLSHCTTLNPVAILMEPLQHLSSPEHDCLLPNHLFTSARDDFADLRLECTDFMFYVDGSSFISPSGQRCLGYGIATHDKVVERGGCETPLSAQKAELFALTQACILAESANIYIWTLAMLSALPMTTVPYGSIGDF